MSNTSSSTSSSADEWKKLTGLIGHTKFCMMATAQSDGTLRSRPMATHGADSSEVALLWFFTYRNSSKVDELEANAHVNLGYVGEGETLFISISGRAELNFDRERMKQLWTPALKAWFPKELDEPNIALLKVTVQQAEYWDNTSNALVQLYGYAKAALTGKPHTGEGQDHAKISLPQPAQ